MRSLAFIIAICWIIFWVYWIISAFGAKKGNPKPAYIKQFIGIRVVIIFIAASLALLGNRFPQSRKNHILGNSEAILILGFIVFLLGLILAVWARVYLGRNWGMPMTTKEDPVLVTTGPYQYIRHPIYSGLLLMGLGSAIDVNAFWLVVFVVSGVYCIYSAVYEERLMASQFPKVYPDYKHRTKMLIPYIL